MEPIKLNITQALNFLPEDEYSKQMVPAMDKLRLLHEKTGTGSDFLGWLNLPSAVNDKQTGAIIAAANELRNEVDVVVVVGIGGSYLGAKAVIEALNHSFDQLLTTRKAPLIMFAGQNLSQDYLADLLEVIDNKNYGIVVISKSGTTTEPALAFRMLKWNQRLVKNRQEKGS